MKWMISFKKLTMKKFKSLCLFTFFMLCLVEFGFSQNAHLQKDLTKKDSLWYYGDAVYTGEVITLSQDQIETRYSVEKGVPSGWFTKYFLDYAFKKSNYKDTSEIRRLNQEIVVENNKLNSLIKDSLLAYNELISYINNDIGGDKKLQKLEEKKQANKLKEKQKAMMAGYVSKKNSWRNSAQNVLLSQQKIKIAKTKQKEEEAKPEVAPKIAEQYEQVNSIKNGSYKSYFDDGRLKSEGTFLNGLYNGAWTYYYSNGKVHAKGSYLMGDEGNFSIYNGFSSSNYKTSTSSGEEWKPPTKNMTDYEIKLEERVQYYKNLNTQNEYGPKTNKLNPDRFEYNQFINNELATIPSKGLEGVWVINTTNGVPKVEFNYKKGKMHGVFKLYYENGGLKEERVFNEGKENGPYILYYESGIIKETGEIIKGVLAGSCIFYNDKGNKIQVTQYIAGKKHGKETLFFNNGKIEEELYYANDRAQGTFKSFFITGQLKIIATLDTTSKDEDGFLGEVIAYKEDGNILKKVFVRKDGSFEDKTPKFSSSLSKVEMTKLYKCKCCKSTINGIFDGIDDDGSGPTEQSLYFAFEINKNSNILDFLNKQIAILGEEPYLNLYDFVRRETYKFCSMKCSRTCHD
jgi:antitoxin component YwqK of YwqJK toxin-antitoxin module